MGYGKPRLGETAQAIRGRGWIVHQAIPDSAVVVRPEAPARAGFDKLGVFEWPKEHA